MGGVPASPSFPMLRFLICAGWIDESYERYMSNFYSESMSSRDAAYLSSLRQAAAVDRDFVPDDPGEIVARIDGPMAARAGARNIHLFKALLDGGGEEKLRQFMESLARDNLSLIHICALLPNKTVGSPSTMLVLGIDCVGVRDTPPTASASAPTPSISSEK